MHTPRANVVVFAINVVQLLDYVHIRTAFPLNVMMRLYWEAEIFGRLGV